MGQLLHGSARTTAATRRAIQASQESVRALARRHGISPTTVSKWKKRRFVTDSPIGPKDVRSSILSAEEEAAVVAFRRHTLLPLDDCLDALQPSLPHLTRSSLHRCLQRHGISRLPTGAEGAPKRGRFAETTLGYVHIDSCEVRAADGKLHLFVAVDRVTKFAYAELHLRATGHGPRATMLTGAGFLKGRARRLPLQDPHGAHRQRHRLR